MESWRLPEGLWKLMEPLIPPMAEHPKGGRPWVPVRRVMEAIWFVMRTGCQWRALNATGLCSSATAERRFREWKAAGVFAALHVKCLRRARLRDVIDWRFLALDGCHVQAPRSRSKKQARAPSTAAGKGRSARCSSMPRASRSRSSWPAATAAT